MAELQALWAKVECPKSLLALSRALMSLEWPGKSEATTRCWWPRRGIRPTLDELRQWPCHQMPREPGVRGGLPVVCTYAHLLWALIFPCARWIAKAFDDSLEDGDDWDGLDFLAKLLAPEFCCEVDEEVQPDLAELCAIQISSHLQVDFPADALTPVFDKLGCLGLPGHSMSAYLVLMSGVTKAFIGTTLHETLMVRLLATAAGAQEPIPDVPLEVKLKQEIVAQHLADQGKLATSGWQELPLVLPRDEPPTKRSRTSESLTQSVQDKTEMVRLALKDKVSLSHLPNTILDAARVIHGLTRSEQPVEEHHDLTDRLYHRTTLGRHMLILDPALDACTAAEWQAIRDKDPEGFGVALASDESPPSQRRFGGYRFQVTLVYLPRWRPEDTWDSCKAPPLDAEPIMADICHCLGKDGRSVIKV